MSANETGSALGRVSVQNGSVQAPRTEPTTKATSVITIALWPLPTAKSVPEAHAPPSCIPMPNRKAPTSTPAPMGASEAAGATPPYDAPPARIGANRVAAAASISMCARRPAPWRTETSWRQAEVNPKREWNSTKPKASPTA